MVDIEIKNREKNKFNTKITNKDKKDLIKVIEQERKEQKKQLIKTVIKDYIRVY